MYEVYLENEITSRYPHARSMPNLRCYALWDHPAARHASKTVNGTGLYRRVSGS